MGTLQRPASQVLITVVKAPGTSLAHRQGRLSAPGYPV